MAIGDLLKSLGQGIDRGFTKIGGYDPSQQVSPEEAFRRKNIGMENLQRTLGRSAAIMSGDPQRLALSAQQDEAARKKQFMDDYIRKNPGQAELIRAAQAGVPMSMLNKGNGKIFEGQGFNNQLFNILLQGQKDPSIRQSPIYKTAYDRLSQPTTETYLNEIGQQVTRKVPGIISPQDYLPPTGVGGAGGVGGVGGTEEQTPFDMGEDDAGEQVIEVTPERRRTLLNQIDTINAAESKVLAFKEKLDVINPNPLTRGEDKADIESSYTGLLLELKNFAELGVLAGEDLKLLQDMVGDPTGFMQFFIKGGTEGIKKQLDNLLSSINSQKIPRYKELGMEMPEGISINTKETAYLGGRQIEVNAAGDGWIYSDTREAVE
tara:strand:+ start:359 stop:1489 length:1131 start_codon:yes stop_codon:yes gene_type:complete